MTLYKLMNDSMKYWLYIRSKQRTVITTRNTTWNCFDFVFKQTISEMVLKNCVHFFQCMTPLFMFTNFDKFQTLESKQVRGKYAKLKMFILLTNNGLTKSNCKKKWV